MKKIMIATTNPGKDLPVLARDDTNTLIGVDEEDDPKNHNKSFVAKRAGEYTDDKGSQVFADIAHKYGGEVWTRFDWGYGLAWHQTDVDGKDEIKVVHGLATTGDHLAKIVDLLRKTTGKPTGTSRLILSNLCSTN